MPGHQLNGMPEAFKHVPLASPLPGVVENLENPESRSYQVHIISVIFVPLSISFMIVRLYAKATTRGQEPGMIVGSTVCPISNSVDTDSRLDACVAALVSLHYSD